MINADRKKAASSELAEMPSTKNYTNISGEEQDQEQGNDSYSSKGLEDLLPVSNFQNVVNHDKF